MSVGNKLRGNRRKEIESHFFEFVLEFLYPRKMHHPRCYGVFIQIMATLETRRILLPLETGLFHRNEKAINYYYYY